MLPSLHGMFAFVVWDKLQRRAFAARDPYGIKPLYYTQTADGVMLASQVRALMATRQVSREPDVLGQAGFWMLGSVPEPRTWFRDVHAIPSGGSLWVEHGRVSRTRRWYDVGESWRQGALGPALPKDEVAARVQAALEDSVRRHLVSDVPVGVFLSGGIDSTAIAAMMMEAGARGVHGVTLSFDEFAGRHEDEAPVASQVAAHYGMSHHVRRVSRDEFLADLPKILDAVEQPSTDGVNSWYATKAVAEAGLKVVVSGVGGDELFMGYDSFRRVPAWHQRWMLAARYPGARPLARWAGRVQAQRTGNPRWRHASEWAGSMAGAWWLSRSMAAPEELPALMGRERAAEALRDFEPEAFVEAMVGPLADAAPLAVAQMESMGYMRNQLLRDSDWASMAHSVELRTPLVDAHLLEQVRPTLAQFDRFPGKTLLAHAPRRPLPRVVTDRRKTGFGIPVRQWLIRGAHEVVTAGPSPRLSGWAAWMHQVVRAYEAAGS